MIKILLSGCQGKMGQVITRLSSDYTNLKIVAGIDIKTTPDSPYPVYRYVSSVTCNIDVIIDFSNPSLFNPLLEFALAKKIPMVICTTGLSTDQVEKIHAASRSIPIFFSANMSCGIHLLIHLVQEAAKALYDDFDIEIIEKHHNKKIDAPSGTALLIADAINSVIPKKDLVFDRHSKKEARKKTEIGMHSIRAGSISGEHSVIFANNDEIIEISHTALSKDVFGVGALNTSIRLLNMPSGLYTNLNELK
ncbi:MAG: 4-hydroxy-tetrahydrodipicolinate reductase [Clostridiales bacterium]|nr:4-hydroxy-tetrahydrodipicolinate reductase [Clostridiales bacterium]